MPKDRCLLSALASLWYPRQQSKGTCSLGSTSPTPGRCHFSTSRAARSGAVRFEAPIPLQRPASPVLPINPSKERLLRAEFGLGICSLMNRTDPGTHLPNRWPRLLFEACLHQVRGVKGSPAEVPEGVREDPLSRCSWKWVLTSDQGSGFTNRKCRVDVSDGNTT